MGEVRSIQGSRPEGAADQASAERERSRGRVLLDLVRTDLSQRSEAVRRIVEAAANTLDVDRVGLWFYDESRTAIVVEDLYLKAEDRHESGARLTAGEYPRYFAALADSRGIAAEDAARDPRTSEFSKSYLEPHQVHSMLDVPVRSEGAVVGVLCHECVGERRAWSEADREFAASLADLVGIVVEASRRRRTEEELRELAASLERRVAERTEELQESNRALVRAIADLEAFCYSVSHDLRAPLRVINGYASLLQGSALAASDADAGESAARIRENTNRMSQLLDGLLGFFRLGRRPMEPTRVDMNVLLRDARRTLHAESTSIEFTADALEPVDGDPALLTDVLVNLLSNAFKFSARRTSPRVHVGCEVVGDEIVYQVRDNGVGFRVDHAARLFEPFQRLHAADGYDGTGVGLAIVRRIVERHGGRVWAEASPSAGATFYFAMPRNGVPAG